MYPSLELVRLESIFFMQRSGTILDMYGSGCNTEFLASMITTYILQILRSCLIKTRQSKKIFKKKLNQYI